MQSPIKRPSGSAVAVLSTAVFGGIGLIYAPAQIGPDDSSWRAAWAEPVSSLGVAVVVGAIVTFGVTHIQWPRWLMSLRLAVYHAPPQHQWLVDIARSDLQDPAPLIVVTNRFIDRWELESTSLRSYVRFWVDVFNGSVYDVLVTVDGWLTIDGERLREDIRPDSSGSVRIPRGTTNAVVFKQYIDAELTAVMHDEIERDAFSRFGLSRVQIHCVADAAEAQHVHMSIDGSFTKRP